MERLTYTAVREKRSEFKSGIFTQSEKRSSPCHFPVHHGEDRDVTDYLYKALDTQGQFVSGRLQAASPIAAVQQLIELGYVPLDTKPSTTERRWSSFLPQPGVPKREILSCSRISLCCCDRDYR